MTDSPDGADVYVVNSCTVTATGDKKTRQSIRKMKREHPGALVVLTGCYPQAFPEEAAGITEADVITGSYNRCLLYTSHGIRTRIPTGRDNGGFSVLLCHGIKLAL